MTNIADHATAQTLWGRCGKSPPEQQRPAPGKRRHHIRSSNAGRGFPQCKLCSWNRRLHPLGRAKFRAIHAKAYRYKVYPHHRGWADCYRPSLRIRLLRHPGLQGAPRRGLPHRSGQLQSRHHHDRPGHWRTRPISSRSRPTSSPGSSRRNGSEHPGDKLVLLPTMGGQTALNTALLSLKKMGVLEKWDVETDRRHGRGHRQGRGPRTCSVRCHDQDRARNPPRCSSRLTPLELKHADSRNDYATRKQAVRDQGLTGDALAKALAVFERRMGRAGERARRAKEVSPERAQVAGAMRAC